MTKISLELDPKEILHIWDHLYSNKIDDPESNEGYSWGNQKEFIKRHKKVKQYLQQVLGIEDAELDNY